MADLMSQVDDARGVFEKIAAGGTMAKAKEVFCQTFDLVKEEMNSEDTAKVQKHVDDILEVVAVVRDIFGDGLQFSDVTRVGEIIGPLMKLAADFSEYRGEDKKRFVQDVTWLVYRTIDTWPDGNHNNINVPFLSGTFERKVERGVVCFAAGLAVEAIYKRLKDGGEV